MKKIRAIAVAMAMTVFLSGCYDYGRDITIICPVINYMAVDGGAIVIYEMDGERREKKFLEKDDVYSCQAKERVQDDINHFKEGFYEKKSSITHVSICYGGRNARRMRFRQWQQQGRVQHRDWISGRGKFFRRDSR